MQSVDMFSKVMNTLWFLTRSEVCLQVMTLPKLQQGAHN